MTGRDFYSVAAAAVNLPSDRTPTNSPTKVAKRRLNRSPAASPTRKSPRLKGSPRRGWSRLPVRRPNPARPVVKELNLPPDESVFQAASPPLPGAAKVTPEKLMQELKEEAARRLQQQQQQQRRIVEVDDEVSIPFTEMVLQSDDCSVSSNSSNSSSSSSSSNANSCSSNVNTNSNANASFNSIANPINNDCSQSPTLRIEALIDESQDSPLARRAAAVDDSIGPQLQRRLSSRLHSAVTVDSPDLPFQDPLQVARQTLHNTRYNSGYKTCQLVYANDDAVCKRPPLPTPASPEYAFSRQSGLQRHMLKLPPSDSDDDSDSEGCVVRGEQKRRLRFNRVLHFLHSPDHDSDAEQCSGRENLPPNQQLPFKSCLVRKQQQQQQQQQQQCPTAEPSKKAIVHVKRLGCPSADIGGRGADSGGVSASQAGAKPRRLFGGARRAPARSQ